MIKLYVFDVMKTVYSFCDIYIFVFNINIVSLLGGRPMNAPTGLWHLKKLYITKNSAITCGRIISSRLKYSRNALHINVLPIARYFRQRIAPSIRHRRRSQGYPYRQPKTLVLILKSQQPSILTGTSKYKNFFVKKRTKIVYPALNFLCKTLYKSVFK